MWQLTWAMLQEMLLSLTAIGKPSGVTSGPLEIVYLGLYQAPTPPPSVNATMAEIAECNFAGYARQEVTWYPQFQDPNGNQAVQGVSMFWQPQDNSAPQNVTGYFLATAPVGGVLLAMQALPSPGYPLTGTVDALTVVPGFALPSLQTYGGAQTVE